MNKIAIPLFAVCLLCLFAQCDPDDDDQPGSTSFIVIDEVDTAYIKRANLIVIDEVDTAYIARSNYLVAAESDAVYLQQSRRIVIDEVDTARVQYAHLIVIDEVDTAIYEMPIRNAFDVEAFVSRMNGVRVK